VCLPFITMCSSLTRMCTRTHPRARTRSALAHMHTCSSLVRIPPPPHTHTSTGTLSTFPAPIAVKGSRRSTERTFTVLSATLGAFDWREPSGSSLRRTPTRTVIWFLSKEVRRSGGRQHHCQRE
jgi:hypothetical protein